MPILNIILAGALLVGADNDVFEVESDFGAESQWTEAYLNDAWKVLVRLMDAPDVAPPRGIRVSLEKDPDMQGIGGYASPVSIGFTSDAWPMDKHRLWILAHELVNLFAAHYGGAGGFPSDWWSNGRSPFPEYVSCLVMEECGHAGAARDRRRGQIGKRDHELFWVLHERHGFALFARFFRLVRADGIDLGLVGPHWPRPSEPRSAYTMAYLSIAAGENVAPLCREHDIGLEPDDWKRIHPEIPFIPYEVTPEEVDDVIAVRQALFAGQVAGKNAADSGGRGIEILRELYRSGAVYRPRPELRLTTPAADCSVSFHVTSEFGSESDWAEAFLGRAAAAILNVLGISDAELPGRVPVVLRKTGDFAGIAGGADRASIELISDCWPDEQFRHWILTQELAKLIGFHLGGNLPADWWGHGNKPFATYAASLALAGMDHGGESDWVRQMHADKPDHEIFWVLHERFGAGWAARFFRLLREDGIDVEAAAASAENPRYALSLRVITYLSLACGENLADLCASHGIGDQPPGWEGSHPDEPFETYRVSAEDVERMIAKR